MAIGHLKPNLVNKVCDTRLTDAVLVKAFLLISIDSANGIKRAAAILTVLGLFRISRITQFDQRIGDYSLGQ